MSHHLSTCTFCGVGCGLFLESQNNEITGVYPSMSHPANHGRLCVRGWHVHEVASSPDRLRTPLLRKNGELVPVSFNEAYDAIAENLSVIKRKYGPDAIGFLDSARVSNEDGYILQKFARSIIGTNNVDQGTSFYRTTTVNVLREMLGIAAATNPLEDVFASKAILLNEIDIGQQLPTLGGAIIRAHLSGTKLIVVGSRRHRVTEHADIFLNIKPGTELFLYAAMAKIIVDRGLMDLEFVRNRCKGYENFLQNIQSFDILHAAHRCDVAPALIEQAVLMYCQNSPGMLLYPSATADIGEDALSAMVNLVLLSGNLGKKGAGIIPLSEHNNAQGGCDMGVMPCCLPGYVKVTDATKRLAIEKRWNAAIPQSQGRDAAEILDSLSPVKALWLDRHNPVVSASYKDAVEQIKKMEFVVLQNLFLTKTAQFAHVVLPVAAYGEEEVTFTSTERRVQLAVKAIEPPQGFVSAWQQVVEVANRMGAKWEYASSRNVLAEIADVVPDYSGISAENLCRDYGRQWPCTQDLPLGTPVLFTESKGSRLFSFATVSMTPPAATVNGDFPFALTFGHSLYYWHQNTLVRHSETLKREYGILLLDYPEGFVEINDEDAKVLTIRDNQKIKLVSPQGSAQTVARVTSEVRKGSIFIPFFLQDVMKTIGKDNVKNTFVRIEKAG